jgi:hypothetical protein
MSTNTDITVYKVYDLDIPMYFASSSDTLLTEDRAKAIFEKPPFEVSNESWGSTHFVVLEKKTAGEGTVSLFSAESEERYKTGDNKLITKGSGCDRRDEYGMRTFLFEPDRDKLGHQVRNGLGWTTECERVYL